MLLAVVGYACLVFSMGLVVGDANVVRIHFLFAADGFDAGIVGWEG